MPAANRSRARRKLIAFDDETWTALDLLARDRMNSVQELADEAFRDLLQKHGRPTDLKAALKQSDRQESGKGNDRVRSGSERARPSRPAPAARRPRRRR
jgi:hypothetical protein